MSFSNYGELCTEVYDHPKDVSVCADFEDGKKPSNGKQKFVYQATKR